MKTLLNRIVSNKHVCGYQAWRNTKHTNLAFEHRHATVRTLFNKFPQMTFDGWKQNSGLFLVPELKSPEGFLKAKDKAIERGWQLLDQVVKAEPGKQTIALFDEISDTLCRVADLADFIRCAHPDKAFTEAANEAHVCVGTAVEELNTNKELHDAMRNVVETEDLMLSFDEETRRVAELFMFDFKISGIHLRTSERSKAVKLHEEILYLTSAVLQGASTSVAVPKKILPRGLQHVFGGPNSNSDFIQLAGLYSDNPDERIREAAYRVFLYPNQDQEAVLCRLLEARHELSQLVGYETFADRALKSTMAQSPENVMNFLNKLSNGLKYKAEIEFNEMKRLKELSGSEKHLMPWDVHYYSTKLKEERSSISNDVYSAYFSLRDCMEGLNIIFNSLYGITLVQEVAARGEVWSPDVIKLAVTHESEGIIGYIYCDFFQRAGKPQQDCHFTIRGGRRMPDGSYQIPVVVLLLHLPSPTSENVTLLHPNAVNNLFHEAGHAMHSMLARTTYQHVTGTRCATDFAEVPSVLMEYYATNEKILSKFAKHYKTRENLPPDLMKSLCDPDPCISSDMQQQVFYSMLDQIFHGVHPLSKSLIEVYGELHNTHYGLPYVPGTAWYLRFSHLASYGAKYYSYLMSRAVASRIWELCFQQDPLNRKMGERYKNEMLSFGGAKDPIHMYKDMLGEEFDMDNLANTLVKGLSN